MSLLEREHTKDDLLPSESHCLRGCARQHWAVCENLSADELARKAQAEDIGTSYTPPCKGCAPSVCRDRSLICDQCWGRASRLLSDAPELLTRLRTMTDGGQSRWNWDRVITTRAQPGPQATGRDDITDAIHAIEETTRYFSAGLEQLQNDHTAMEWLGPLVLDDHLENADGVREQWSVRDAMRRWGLESRHRFVHPGAGALPNAPAGSYALYDDDDVLGPVREWFDPLLTAQQAAERAGVTEAALRKWVDRGRLSPAATSRGPKGAVSSYYHASSVDAARAQLDDQRAAVRELDSGRARELFHAGTSLRAMSRTLGISVDRLSRWAAAEGLSFSGRAKLDPSRARALHNAGHTVDGIAEALGVKVSAVNAWRRAEGLTRGRGAGASFDTTKARELYDAGHSTRAMAAELGTTASTISKWGKAEGLTFGSDRVRSL